MTAGGTALPRVAVLFTALVVVFFLLLASGVRAGGREVPREIYVVQSGDTLWEIAESRTAPGADIRVMVWELQTLNGLSGGTIHPGDRIILP